MRKIEMDIDENVLFMNPQQAIQEFSLKLLADRAKLVDNIKGMEWKNSTTKGKIVDISTNIITVETQDKKKHELPVTSHRIRALLAAVTTR